MELTIRRAEQTDLPLLAQMNKHLIEDEGSANPMTVGELERRMRGWLEGAYKVDLFGLDGAEDEVMGYAVYQPRGETSKAQEVICLRQFFIERRYRRRGLGRRAFERLREKRFAGARVTLEVLTANPAGLSFWEALGFREYAVTMALERLQD